MSTSLNQIYNKIEGDRDATFDILLSILDVIKNSHKLSIGSSSKIINYDVPAYPDDVVYYNAGFLFIPEKILENRILGTTYIGIEDIVSILKNTRVKHKKILSDDFYKELTVSTPVGRKKVNTLVLNYRPMAWIIGCLGEDLD